MAEQHSSVSTSFNLENINADMSTTIGLQGEDFANLLNAMNNKDVINTQAILAQTNQLAKVAEASQGLGATALKQIFGGDSKKMLLSIGVGILGIFALLKFIKRRKK